MTGAALRVDDLRKMYDGRTALDGLSFTVPRGSICGMVGPNGAGKTTTQRIVMGFTTADRGRFDVLGMEGPMRPATLRQVACVPDLKELYPFARAGEIIRIVRDFYPDWDAMLERRLTNELGLRPDAWCRSLSKGALSGLWLLLALCRRPNLLLLDEATEGLDPVALDIVQRALIQQVAERGTTVLFSTHQLHDVEQLADYVVIVDKGRCAIEGALDDIRQRYHVVRCSLEDDGAAVPPALADWRRDGRFLTGLSHDDPAILAERLVPIGVHLLDAQPASLKDVFLAETGRA